MNIKKLAISNSRRIVGVFKKILSNLSTRPDTFNNAILDFPKSKVSNNAVSDLS